MGHRSAIPFAFPALLVLAIVAPYTVLPLGWAVPASFAATVIVEQWMRLRQRPRGNRTSGSAYALRLPLHGSWQAVNTPARRVPSHGTHLLAQTYALDFVSADEALRSHAIHGWRSWLGLERPERFFGFGQPVLSPCGGQVVSVADGSRDHRGFNSWAGLLLWFVQQLPRSFMGSKGLLGNHIILRVEEGVYAVFAHLRRGSLRVGPGDQVQQGQALAECGNSGNSTEPHLHFQLMDSPNVWAARGVPVVFMGYEVWHPSSGWEPVSRGLPNRGQRVRGIEGGPASR